MALLIAPQTTEHPPSGAPGVIELTEELEIVAVNDSGRVWLAELTTIDSDRLAGMDLGRHPSLPHAITAIVSQLRSVDTDATGSPPRLPVRTRSGRWLILHASRLHRSATEARIAIIVEAPQPLELAPLITGAYGLSAREREICLLVLRGLPTSHIAQRLYISSNTVQDHLKAVFEKTGTRSRRELVGRLFLASLGPPEPT